MQQVARGIYYEENFLGVVLGGLVFSHGTIFIDAPLRAEDARAWRSLLLNQRGGSNRLLVNLDAHPDRTLGARSLDCTIVAHLKTAHVFRNRPTIFKGQSIETGSDWETYPDAIGMRWASPDITFSDTMSLHWGGPELVLEHRPGPTPGAIWVSIPAEKILFVGDGVVAGQPPFFANADLPVWIDTLDVLLNQYADYKIISGRSGLVQLEQAQTLQTILKDINQEMEALARRNAAPEAVEDQTSDLLERFGGEGEQHEVYLKRLQYGLYQYYARRYRMANTIEMVNPEDEEQ